MKSIYGKLILGFLVSIFISFSVAGYFSLKKNTNDLGVLTIEELESSSDFVALLIEKNHQDDIQDMLEGYCLTSEIDVSIYTTAQEARFGSHSISLNYELVDKLILETGENISMKEATYRKYAKSYEINGENFVIYVQKDVSKREMIFIESGVIAIFMMLAAGSIIFFIIADIIVKPISRLIKATQELSNGNYRVRVNYTGNDEIATLNRNFNLMAQQLGKQEEVRQQFISDVSHEFQTPLTAIQGFATIIKNEELAPEQKLKYADIILFHSKRLSTLSRNMLQLTLLEGEDVKLELSEFSLIGQLRRVIDTQNSLAQGKDIEIEFTCPKHDVLIEADESRLEQVWINLINNAIKYTQDHGVVMIDIKKASSYVEVTISDTGVGMSKEAMAHIFERFYRQDKSRSIEGNGLGLSIVKRIVDLHNGNIDVVSREDGGSRFIVKIPQEKVFNISDKLNIAKMVKTREGAE